MTRSTPSRSRPNRCGSRSRRRPKIARSSSSRSRSIVSLRPPPSRLLATRTTRSWTSEYGEHMANAAAELAQVESLEPDTATLVIQLQQRIDEHRATAAAVVARLTEDPNTASAAAALAPFAARGNPAADLSPAAAIAQDAADTADEAAAVAERKATPAQQVNAPQSSGGADRNAASADATPRDGQ